MDSRWSFIIFHLYLCALCTSLRLQSKAKVLSKLCLPLYQQNNADGNFAKLIPVSDKRQLESGISFYSGALSTIIGSQILTSNCRASHALENKVPFSELVQVECSDSILVLSNTKNNRFIILIGTAHISEESANLVRRTVQNLRPDIVMIELDLKRIGRVKQNQLNELGIILPKESIIGLSDTVDISSDSVSGSEFSSQFKTKAQGDTIIKKTLKLFSFPVSFAQQAAGALLGKALSQFYNSVEKLGFTAGGEFKAAVEEAKKINAKILLGDRDVDITLQRLATALSVTNPSSFESVVNQVSVIEEQLGFHLDDSAGIGKKELSSFVEGIKQKEVVNRLMLIIKKEMPEVYGALIGERDLFMAKSMAEAPSKGVLVGVVGLAHIAGIERALNTYGFTSVARNCPAIST